MTRFIQITLLFFSIFLWSQCFGQRNYSSKIAVHLTPNTSQDLVLEQAYSSIQIKGEPSLIKSISIQVGALEIPLRDRIDYHTHPATAFVVFESPTANISLISAQMVDIEVQLFYAPSLNLDLYPIKRKVDNCEKPTTIAASTWREGLAEPTPGRNATIVRHCIIHHTAGSNSDLDYINVVRNIYLAHTRGNGWDDIGYNFLVAQDGTIFSGRDAEGVADEDNIQGAHFCGKNGSTMGIALLGNFNLTTPSSLQTDALESLLNWKMHKESLDPHDQFPHPNNLGSDLGTIGIHRDGCSTSCPGDSLALLVPRIKNNVRASLLNCGLPLGIISHESEFSFNVFPNPSKGNITIQSENSNLSTYRVISSLGQILANGQVDHKTNITIEAPSGIYYILLNDSWGNIAKRKISIIGE